MKFAKGPMGLFVAGLVLGKHGKEIFGGKKAKEVYVKTTVLGLKAKDAVVESKEMLTAGAQDIYAEAVALKEKEENEKKEAESEEVFADCSCKK